MTLTFKPIKIPGLPKFSSKLSQLSGNKIPSTPNIKAPSVPKDKITKGFNIAKYSKIVKLPKAPKLTMLKAKVKKIKGF